MKNVVRHICQALLLLCLPVLGAAQEDAPDQVLFTNVHVFDGVSENRIENANVLIEGNKIKAVSTEDLQAPGATVIDSE